MEYGWGEFEAIIRIYFHDAGEKFVEFFHPLRLFADNSGVSKEPVVSEFYDEIVFQDPSEKLLATLKTTPHGVGDGFRGSHLAAHFKDFSTAESVDLKKIEEARRRTREETIKRQERYEELEIERAALVREITPAAAATREMEQKAILPAGGISTPKR